LDELEVRLPDLRAELALLTSPAEAAPMVAERLCRAGIRGILNFAPTVLRLPDSVRLVNVDLVMQLEQLAFQVQLRTMA